MTWPPKKQLPTYIPTPYLPTSLPLQNTLWELIGPKLTHLLSFASLLCSCCRCHWWKGWLCHLNLGSQVFCCCWMKIGLAQAFCLRGSRRCQRGVQILHSTFTQHLIWSQPQSTPTKGHSFSDLCISGHFWRRQRRVCYGVSKIDILCDTLFTSNRIPEGAGDSQKDFVHTVVAGQVSTYNLKKFTLPSQIENFTFGF